MKDNFIGPLMFILGGIIFIFMGIFFYNLGADLRKNGVEHTAVISDIQTSQRIEHSRKTGSKTDHTVYVRYEVNGQEYEQSLDYYSSNMYVGKEVRIYYNPDYPYQITHDKSSSLKFLLAFGGLGSVAIILGLRTIISLIRTGGTTLLTDGNYEYAEIVDVVLFSISKSTNTYLYTIFCRWIDPDSKNEYNFRSEVIKLNSELLKEDLGVTTLPVYFNIVKPKRYFVDISRITSSLQGRLVEK